MTEKAAVNVKYVISEAMELNLSYMPFIKNGGLFVPTDQIYPLGTLLTLELKLPEKKESIFIDGKVMWITPKNALHHITAGVGIQFSGDKAKNNKTMIEAALDPALEVGGYTYGILEEVHKPDHHE